LQARHSGQQENINIRNLYRELYEHRRCIIQLVFDSRLLANRPYRLACIDGCGVDGAFNIPRTRVLLTASFRFHLAMNTLAVRLKVPVTTALRETCTL
jgi:hypothetical protein